jgi:hypothetical protein
MSVAGAIEKTEPKITGEKLKGKNVEKKYLLGLKTGSPRPKTPTGKPQTENRKPLPLPRKKIPNHKYF